MDDEIKTRIYECDEKLNGKVHVDVIYDNDFLSVYKQPLGEHKREEIFHEDEYEDIALNMYYGKWPVNSLYVDLEDFSAGSYNIKSIDLVNDSGNYTLDIELF